jgi:Protein of unknown function (DUF2842)
MSPRLRRLIGACLIMLLVLVYALVAALIGDVVATTQPKLVQILYFFVAGLLWIVPVGAIIKWMYRVPAR